MWLSLLLLTLLPTAQVTSVDGPPLEVLEAEVVVQKLRPRTGRDIKPLGAVGSEEIQGTRAKRYEREQPTIEDRSIVLGRVARRSGQADLPRSSGGYIYEYRVRVKNTGAKKIKSVVWEYQVTDGSATTVVPQRVFLCAASIKPGSVKQLAARTPSPPRRVVNAEDTLEKQNVIVNGIEFSDGSTWIREGWKDADASSKTRNLVNGQCTLL